MKENNHPEEKSSPVRRTKIVWTGFFVRIFVIVLLSVLFYGGFLAFKFRQLEKRVIHKPNQETSLSSEVKSFFSTAKSLVTSEKEPLQGEESGRINVLLLGMGGEGHKGKHLTDTIMVLSIDPTNYKSAMISIPRDLYVEIPDRKIYTKINAVYAYELKNQEEESRQAFSGIKKVAENVLDQEIHYYVALDFDGFKQIIDELGGIDVEVEHDIYDPSYPGPNYSYETFEISKGFHHLDAETALKYARVRHTKGGDFGRAARQQQVIAAAKKKAFSLGSIANPQKISSLLDILGGHLQTNIQVHEIPRFIQLAGRINVHETTNRVLDAWSPSALLASTHVELGGVWAYVLQPRARNYSQIHELAENIFTLDQIERKKEEIEKESASVLIIPQSSRDYYRVAGSFKKLGYETTIRSDVNASPCLGEDEIYSYSTPAKLFTLDDLADKLNAKVTYLETYLESDFGYDIAVCISDETALYFEKQNQNKDEEQGKSGNVLGEDGTILINSK